MSTGVCGGISILAVPLELRRIERIVEKHETQLTEQWNDYFDID